MVITGQWEARTDARARRSRPRRSTGYLPLARLLAVANKTTERIQSMRKLLIASALAAMMLIPSQAVAQSHNPTGEFAQFAECPLSQPVFACVYSESDGGFFQTGAKTVTLVNPVVLQGGLKLVEGEETQFVGAENGETLSKTPQPVPGGLFGVEAPGWWPGWLQTWFNNHINEGLTGVNATVEVAGPDSNIVINSSNLLAEEGTAISLPVKIKLSNALLGNNCYIGSDSNPIVIDFTSGTTEPPPPNEPISGSAGTLEFNKDFTLITVSGGALVNNSYGAPEADGCGGLFSFFIDPLVNDLVDLPSPAGTNAATLEGKLQTGDPEAIEASEE